MHQVRRCLARSFAALTLILAVQPLGALAQTAAESLYAELAKMPAAERAARIVEGAKKEGTFNFVDTLAGKDGRDITALFAKQVGGYLKAQEIQMGSQDGADRILTEEAAGKHLTDLVVLSVPDMAALLKREIPAVYPTPATEGILPQYKSLIDPKNRWVPMLWSDHGIVYNSKVLRPDEIPSAWEDACGPAMRGRASYDPGEVRWLSGLWNMFGRDFGKLAAWLKCVGENQPIIQRGHNLRMNLMLAGDHAASFDQYLHYGTALRNANPEKNPFAAVFTAPILAYTTGSILNKKTPHPYAAALYADFSLGEEVQKYIVGIYRGALKRPHANIPDSATLVPVSYNEDPTTDVRLQELWKQYVGVKR